LNQEVTEVLIMRNLKSCAESVGSACVLLFSWAVKRTNVSMLKPMMMMWTVCWVFSRRLLPSYWEKVSLVLYYN